MVDELEDILQLLEAIVNTLLRVQDADLITRSLEVVSKVGGSFAHRRRRHSPGQGVQGRAGEVAIL